VWIILEYTSIVVSLIAGGIYLVEKFLATIDAPMTQKGMSVFIAKKRIIWITLSGPTGASLFLLMLVHLRSYDVVSFELLSIIIFSAPVILAYSVHLAWQKLPIFIRGAMNGTFGGLSGAIIVSIFLAYLPSLPEVITNILLILFTISFAWLFGSLASSNSSPWK